MPANLDSHLELTREHYLGVFVAHPFHIWRSQDSLELNIFPCERKPSEVHLEDVCCFQCDLPSDVPRDRWKQTPSARLELRIHYTLLGTATANSRVSTEMTSKDLQDPVVEELALAVMSSLAVGVGNSYTVACITKMLCARLSQTQQLGAATNIRRFEDWQITILKDALAEVTEEYVSVPSIALRCRLSVCHFSRLFRASFGMPLHRYRVGEQIRQAKSRLAETADPISQIALEFGFADQASFTRRFTAIAGIPPATWRRNASQQSMRHDIRRPQSRFANA